MPKFNNLSLADTYGRGQRELQQENYNALRLDGMKQENRRAQQTFDKNQQRANTEKLLNGIQIVRGNRSMAPTVVKDLVDAGIMDPEKSQEILEFVTNSSPGEFDKLLGDAISNLQYALGPQEKPDLAKDAAGYNRYASGNSFGERAFPDAQVPLKAPTTRSIVSGSERIDQEFNSDTGDFFEVGRGPRSVVQKQETGPPGSFKTGSQTGAQEVELENAAAATIQAVATAGDLVDLVRSNKSIVGISGSFFRITNDLAQTANGIAEGLGVTFEGNFETLTNPDNYDFSKFRGTAIDSAVMQSGIVSLAFAAAAASGQEGRSISDKDIQRFVNEIGGSTSDPRAFEVVIRKFTERLARNFTISANVRRLNRPDLIQQISDSLDTRSDEATREAQSLSGFNELSLSDQQELIQLLRERR